MEIFNSIGESWLGVLGFWGLAIDKIKKIYSIKDSTDGKSDVEIVEIIRNELEIFNDEEFVWNKMIYSISQVNLCEVPKQTGKRIWN